MRRTPRPFQSSAPGGGGWGGAQTFILAALALATVAVLASVLAIGIVVVNNTRATSSNTEYIKTGSIWATEQIQLAEVKAGNVPGFHAVLKMGRNEGVGPAQETVWAGGGLYPFLDTAELLLINSTSAADTAAGTGGRTLYVAGIGADGRYLMETVTLDGTSSVLTTNAFLRVYRLRLNTAGSSQTNEGDIMAWAASSSQLQAVVGTGLSTTQLGIFSIAVDHDGWLESFSISVESGVFGSVQHIEVYLRENGVVVLIGDWGLQGGLGTSAFHEPLETPVYLPPGSTVEFRATSSAMSTTVSVVFGIIVHSLPGATTHP